MSDRAPSWADGARQRMSASSAAPRAAAATRRIPAHWPRRAMVIAVGLTGSVLLAATIIWALGRSGPREVPVIEADSRPFRVRPEGMTPLPPAPPPSGTAARPAETRLAPAAEAPRPELLRQQPAAAPAAGQPRQAMPPAAPATPAPTTPAAAPPPRSAAPAAPQPAATPPAAPTAAARPAGRAQVQLAAVGSEEAARAEWDRLRRRHPELASLTPRFQRVEREGQSAIWRVRATGVADAEAARSLCAAIRQRGGGCNPA